MFYKNAAAIIVCYDATSRTSFEGMRRWLDEVRQNVNVMGQIMMQMGSNNNNSSTTSDGSSSAGIVVAIAALKTDLLQEKNGGRITECAVPEQEVQQLAEALGVLYLPTSAKHDQNVGELFLEVADRVLENRQVVGGVVGGGLLNNKDNNMLLDKDKFGTNLNNSPTITSDDRIKITSPRNHRDQFDKYYVSGNNDNDHGDNDTTRRQQHPHGNINGDILQPNTDDDQHDTSFHSDTPKKEKKSNNSRRSSHDTDHHKHGRPITPSTDGTASTKNEEGDGDHPILAEDKNKQNKIRKKKVKTSVNNNDGLFCEEDEDDEPYGYTCQPVACGAGDGAGCIVQ